MKLKHALLALFGFVTVLPLALLWAWLAFSTAQSELAGVKDRHLLIARNLATALHNYHEDLSVGFTLIAQNLAEGRSIALTGSVIERLKFRHICVADARTGVVTHQAAPPSAPCPAKVPAKRFAMFKALAAPDRLRFSQVMKGPHGKPLMFVVKRIGGKLAVGAIKTDHFVALGKSVSFGVRGHAAIVDHAGNVLAHPLESWTTARRNIAGVAPVARLLKGESGVAQFHSPALNEEMVAGFAVVSGPGWGVMVPEPMSELMGRAGVARNALFVVIAIGVLGAVLLAGLFTHLLGRPLNRMIEAAAEIEKGNTAARIHVLDRWYLPRELRDAQYGFNAMAGAVEKVQKIQARRRQLAERDSKDKSEYLAKLGHELRTPLNSILGFSNMMRQEPYGPLGHERYREFLRDIDHGASHLLNLINDLLDLTRAETGAFVMKEEAFDLSDAIERCRSILRPEVEELGTELSICMPRGGLQLRGDERAVNQLLINLVANAVRYSGEGGRVEIAAMPTNDGSAILEVSDNGCGIPPGDIERVLQPFVRVERSDGADVKGSGLGLAIVAKLAEAHDAELSIESELGSGTTVRLRFPAERVITVGAAAAASAA